jgi:hypothetical protein
MQADGEQADGNDVEPGGACLRPEARAVDDGCGPWRRGRRGVRGLEATVQQVSRRSWSFMSVMAEVASDESEKIC